MRITKMIKNKCFDSHLLNLLCPYFIYTIIYISVFKVHITITINIYIILCITYRRGTMNKDSHSDPNVESSHTKIDNYFANYFLKTDAKNKFFMVLKFSCLGLWKVFVSFWNKLQPQKNDEKFDLCVAFLVKKKLARKRYF